MLKKFLMGIALVIAGTLGTATTASAAECTLYEQSHPAFLLDGAHLSTGQCNTCASCHKGGVFVGTPKSCVACHNGDPLRTTVGRSVAHIPTQMVECSSCHRTTSFTVNANMDHSTVTQQRCDTCHSGSYKAYGANGKETEHIPTTADCLSCHTTNNWDVSHSAIHAGITTGCVTCHDGNYAPGKSSYAAGHPVTSDACETCHSIDNSFKCASAIDKIYEFFAVLFNQVKTNYSTAFA